MTAQKGSAFLLKISNGATPPVYNTVAGLRTTQLSITGDTVVITTKESGGWRELLSGAGTRSVTVSAAGIFLGSAAEGQIHANALAGTITGSITVAWRIPSFIVSLGVLDMARGVAYQLTDSRTAYIGDSFAWLSNPIAFGISPSFIIALLVIFIAQAVLTRTVFGRYLIGIGTNEEAVRLAGINPKPYKILVFSLMGLLAGIAALFQISRLEAADPNAGSGLELQVIAAVVIGGTSLMGGRGSVISTLFGVLIIAVLEAGLAQVGVSDPSKRIVTGCVIVVAVIIDTLRQRRSSSH